MDLLEFIACSDSGCFKELHTIHFWGLALFSLLREHFRILPCDSHVQFLGAHRTMQDELKLRPAITSHPIFRAFSRPTISQIQPARAIVEESGSY